MVLLSHYRKTKDERLGSARGRRRYDLPLNKSAGAGFLVILIALMTFLALMTLSATFALNGMTRRWSSGLENRLTIEIPAETPGGEVRSSADIAALSSKVVEILKNAPNVKDFTVMEKPEIQELISPWIGDDLVLDNIPLPGLIAVEMEASTPLDIEKLSQKVTAVTPGIKLDTHEEWLGDLLRLTHSLKISAALITAVITLTTIFAIAGAVRSRMAEHKADVELLHLMGASDLYIAKQFQRHALIMAFQGALIGTGAGALTLLLIGFVAGDTAAGLLPDFHLNAGHVGILSLLPGAVCIISSSTAYFTVLHVLSKMP